MRFMNTLDRCTDTDLRIWAAGRRAGRSSAAASPPETGHRTCRKRSQLRLLPLPVTSTLNSGQCLTSSSPPLCPALQSASADCPGEEQRQEVIRALMGMIHPGGKLVANQYSPLRPVPETERSSRRPLDLTNTASYKLDYKGQEEINGMLHFKPSYDIEGINLSLALNCCFTALYYCVITSTAILNISGCERN